MKRNSGYAALTRAISGGQYSSSGGVPPHVRAKISLHISIAMSQRSPSHCAARSSSVSPTASRSAGRERVELHDVRPRREVRVAPAGDPARADLHRPDRIGRVAGHQQLRARRGPRVVGRDVVRDVVEDQLQPELRQPGARDGQRVAPAEPRVDHVVAHAVGRADHVRVAQVGQRGAVARLEPGVVARDRQPRRAPLPDAHQPDRLDPRQRDGLPRDLVQPPPGEPDRRVDLVDHGAQRAFDLVEQRHRAGPARLVARPDPGAVVAVEVLVEQDQVAPVRVGLELLHRPVDRPLPVFPRVNVFVSRCPITPATCASVSSRPEPVGHSTLNSSP